MQRPTHESSKPVERSHGDHENDPLRDPHSTSVHPAEHHVSSNHDATNLEHLNRGNEETNRDVNLNEEALRKLELDIPDDPTMLNKPSAFPSINPQGMEFRATRDTIVREYTSNLPKDYPSSSKELKQHGRFITPESAEKLLNDPAFKDSVGVIDLRSEDIGDRFEKMIPGSISYPFKSGADPILSKLALLDVVGEPYDLGRQALWNKVTEERFETLVEKPVVIIHCLQSTSRTPMFASGYIRYVAAKNGQKVVILKGGFEAYEQTAKPEHIQARPDNK